MGIAEDIRTLERELEEEASELNELSAAEQVMFEQLIDIQAEIDAFKSPRIAQLAADVKFIRELLIHTALHVRAIRKTPDGKYQRLPVPGAAK